MTKSLHFGLTIRTLGDEPEITITTPARDLMRDTIDPQGMDVTSYLNGTRAVNFAHDHSRLPWPAGTMTSHSWPMTTFSATGGRRPGRSGQREPG